MNGRDPAEVRIAIVCDNFSPQPVHQGRHQSRRLGRRQHRRDRPTPTNSSWLNRIEAQFTALRYIAWRNRHAHDQRLRAIVDRANVA